VHQPQETCTTQVCGWVRTYTHSTFQCFVHFFIAIYSYHTFHLSVRAASNIDTEDVSYLESPHSPSGCRTEDSPACCLSASYRWSVEHACVQPDCYPKNLQRGKNTHNQPLIVCKTALSFKHTHLHCAMAKTRSLSSSSSR
jgi:hypothetical protein